MVHFINVLLPKNSNLREKALQALKETGFKEKEIETIDFRGEDIPFLVEQFNASGRNVLGITGEDLFAEYCMEKTSTLSTLQKFEWKQAGFLFGKPCLCLLSKGENKWKKKNVVAINKKYRRISDNFLEKFRRDGIGIETIEVCGNTELAVSKGLAGKCIEIVCSGKTMKELELTVEEKVFESDIVLIGKKGLNETFGLDALYSTIMSRRKCSKEKSYTKRLFEDEELLARKLNEECFELVSAFSEGKRTKIVWEACDVLYFLTVMLVKSEATMEEIWNELRRRNNERKRD